MENRVLHAGFMESSLRRCESPGSPRPERRRNFASFRRIRGILIL